ncbi:MAG: sigma-54-dependent Fis family transcriptional regulator [Desulfobacter sp.]|nr:sigma-54-dependent Fis family transcriptional regulator [Desulfobacter sp.]
MSTSCQLKLLRLIQENEYYPIGGDAPLESSARIIAATNSPDVGPDPENAFRQDLYYRLATHHIHIPALRQRPEDIPVLLDFFLEKFSREMGKKLPTPPQELYSLLSAYEFQGNIRELESMTFEAVSLHKSRMLSMDVFRQHIEKNQTSDNKKLPLDSASPFSHLTAIPKLKDCSSLLIQEALNRSCGNKDTAARLLGITRSGLNKALKRKGISVFNQ